MLQCRNRHFVVLLLKQVSSPHLGNKKRFPCLHICKPSTLSRVCPTIESLFICRLCIHSKTFSNVFIDSVTREKKTELFVYGTDKGEILTSREVLYTKFCKRNFIKFLFCKKDTFQNRDFPRLNVSLGEKNN